MSNSNDDLAHTNELVQTGPADLEGIEALYQTYLGRNVDEGAREAIRKRGMTLRDVEQMIFDSPEFSQCAMPTMEAQRGEYDGSILAIWPAKVLFCPIAKVANTAVKDWSLRLVGDGQAEPGDSHNWLDFGHNKMQVRHMTLADFDNLSRDKDWVSVALIRDPIDRLISSYCDKFGRHRELASALHHTRPVYKFFNGGEEPSAEFVSQGISFRQFCFYLSRSPRETLDPHWTPQWNYLKNHSWDRLFPLEKIQEFEAFVRDRLPENLRHERLKVSNAATIEKRPFDQDLSMSLPAEWSGGGYKSPPYDAFLTDDLINFIRNYYALDFLLYESVAA